MGEESRPTETGTQSSVEALKERSTNGSQVWLPCTFNVEDSNGHAWHGDTGTGQNPCARGQHPVAWLLTVDCIGSSKKTQN